MQSILTRIRIVRSFPVAHKRKAVYGPLFLGKGCGERQRSVWSSLRLYKTDDCGESENIWKVLLTSLAVGSLTVVPTKKAASSTLTLGKVKNYFTTNIHLGKDYQN